MSGLAIIDRFDRSDGQSQETYYYRRRRERRARSSGDKPTSLPVATKVWLPTVADIAGVANLMQVFERLMKEAGLAPGRDRIVYTDIGRRELGQIMRTLSKALLDGSYRPQPGRKVPIPKLGSSELRWLTLRNILDRVVATALKEALEPYWETQFLDRSLGFRPGRGTWDVLARLEQEMVATGGSVLAVDDVRKAFDWVNIDKLMEFHREHIADPALLELIEVVLRGGDADHRIGIDQGSAYSPLALNLYLHFAHDRHFGDNESPRWYRYADNLCYLCQSVPEGRQVLQMVNERLGTVDLTLKSQVDVTDLARDEAQFLGFTLSRLEDQLELKLGSQAWQQLEQHLAQAHEADDPTRTAQAIVRGWVEAYGPANGKGRDDMLHRVLELAVRSGFREIVSPNLTERVEAAWQRWQVYRRRHAPPGLTM